MWAPTPFPSVLWNRLLVSWGFYLQSQAMFPVASIRDWTELAGTEKVMDAISLKEDKLPLSHLPQNGTSRWLGWCWGNDARVHLSLDQTALEIIILLSRKQCNAVAIITARVLSPGSVALPLDTKLGVNGHGYPAWAHILSDRTVFQANFFHLQTL